jgi:serine phosphatase RsbU (regulator of sigma subunit)
VRAELSSRELMERIFAAADEFAGEAAQHDDQTLIVVRRS